MPDATRKALAGLGSSWARALVDLTASAAERAPSSMTKEPPPPATHAVGAAPGRAAPVRDGTETAYDRQRCAQADFDRQRLALLATLRELET